MAHTLPNRRHHNWRQKRIKNTLDNQRRTLHMVSVHINTHKRPHSPNYTQRKQPVPFPPPPNWRPALINRQIQIQPQSPLEIIRRRRQVPPSMLPQPN